MDIVIELTTKKEGVIFCDLRNVAYTDRASIDIILPLKEVLLDDCLHCNITMFNHILLSTSNLATRLIIDSWLSKKQDDWSDSFIKESDSFNSQGVKLKIKSVGFSIWTWSTEMLPCVRTAIDIFTRCVDPENEKYHKFLYRAHLFYFTPTALHESSANRVCRRWSMSPF